MFITESSGQVVIVLTDGSVWMVLNELKDHKEVYNWHTVTHVNHAVVSASMQDSISEEGIGICTVILAHPEGSTTYMQWKYTVAHHGMVYSPHMMGSVLSHPIRAINVWVLDELVMNDCSYLHYISCSVKGECSVCTVPVQSQFQLLSEHINNNTACTITNVVSGGRHIVTSAVLIGHHIVHGHVYAVGDCRGGITVFAIRSTVGSVCEVIYAQYMSRVHGTDPVNGMSRVAEVSPRNDKGCYEIMSMGQDGMLIQYQIQCGIDDMGTTLNLRVHILTRVSCYPIVYPDYIVTNGVNTYIGGYCGDEYIVLDLTVNNSKYQHMRVGGGGWKRPHACAVHSHSTLQSPNVWFAQAIPNNYGTNLSVITNNIAHRQSWPTHINNLPLGFSKVCYAVTAITDELGSVFIYGGEEGIIRVYSHPPLNIPNPVGLTNMQEMHLPGYIPVRALSSCEYSRSNSFHESSEDQPRRSGIVVAAGGKLTYSIWTYISRTTAATSSSSSVFCHLAIDGACIWAGATQDHRILTVACTSVYQQSHANYCHCEQYCVVFGDSRGMLTVGMFYPVNVSQENSNIHGKLKPRVDKLWELQCSDYPILSCSLVSIYPDMGVYGMVAGDSHGTVYWYLLCLKHSAEANSSACSSHVQLLYIYKAHDMGVNCLDVLSRDHSSLHGSSVSSGAITGKLITMVSGGDDQSMCVLHMHMNPSSNHDSSADTCIHYSVYGKEVCRRERASGSALKGVCVYNHSKDCCDTVLNTVILSVGYDRRVHTWRLLPVHTQSSEHVLVEGHFSTYSDAVLYNALTLTPCSISYTDCSSTVSNKLIRWESACIVHISDIGGMCAVTTSAAEDSTQQKVLVGVVGEGLQTIVV